MERNKNEISSHECKDEQKKDCAETPNKKEQTWKDKVKADRKKVLNTFNLVYDCFENLGYNKKEPEFFCTNASEIIDKMREKCWKEFSEKEREFTVGKIKELFALDNKNLSVDEFIDSVCANRLEDLYGLFLSNTQSRRSRAGNEFEAIIELLLFGADIPFENQASIKSTNNTDSSKSIDFIIPSAKHFERLKQESVIVSAKTSLRERWQEVTDEIAKTKASNIYLITLDNKISYDTLKMLDDTNIIIATTSSIKKEIINPLDEQLKKTKSDREKLSDKDAKSKYDEQIKTIEEKIASFNTKLVTFEDLMDVLKSRSMRWKQKEADLFFSEDIQKLKDSIERQINAHKRHHFVLEKLNKRKEELLELEKNKNVNTANSDTDA